MNMFRFRAKAIGWCFLYKRKVIFSKKSFRLVYLISGESFSVIHFQNRGASMTVTPPQKLRISFSIFQTK